MTKTEIKVYEIRAKKMELAKVIGMMHAGREKNVKKAKMIRKEIVRMLMKKGDK